MSGHAQGSSDDTRTIIRELQAPIPDLATLLSLLTGPLDSVGLLPPIFLKYRVRPLERGSVSISRHFSAIQRALLEHIAPTWDSALAEIQSSALLDQFFCPDSIYFTSASAGSLAVLAYSTILSLPLTDYSVRLLARLSKEYPVDRLYSAIFSVPSNFAQQSIVWEDYVRNLCSVPGKVANYTGQGSSLATVLEPSVYFADIALRFDNLIKSFAVSLTKDQLESLNHFLTKLVNIGVFPSSIPVSMTQPSFFQAILPLVQARILEVEYLSYFLRWNEIFRGFASVQALRRILISLFASAPKIENTRNTSPQQRAQVKQQAVILDRLIGGPAQSSELWDTVSGIIMGREWDEGRARIFVCWVAGADGISNNDALKQLLEDTLAVWGSLDHVKHSLLAHHHYLTSLLLLVIAYLPKKSTEVESLSTSSTLLSALSAYIGHLDPSVRRCGMLVAEVVAHLTGKGLDFGDWDGDNHGKLWAREIRALIQARDMDADLGHIPLLSEADHTSETATKTASPKSPIKSSISLSRNIQLKPSNGYDSDDSLTGYASEGSSRSASPTPSELEELEKDPTLGVGVKKVTRPVYLAQLGALLRPPAQVQGDANNEDVEKLQMALDCAEELIRKKQGYGSELSENAVNIAYGLIGRQNNYDLEDFDTKRQSALNALVACSPRTAAPCLIEEFFKNQYSIDQRFVILNALALGARELSSLSVPPSTIPAKRIAFPSKMLPPTMHEKYLKAEHNRSIPLLLEGITRQAISNSQVADTPSELVRERRLRVQKPKLVSEYKEATPMPVQTPPTTFSEVAAECFIAPLINRFWQFLRDEQTREERTAHLDGNSQYRGAGTGLILNPIILSRLLGTLAVLVHASQNALEWSAIIGPESLELAVTLGTKPLSLLELEDDEDGMGHNGGGRGKEASILTSALELALVVLDGYIEFDGGKTLGLEHTALLMGTGEWAGSVFAQLEKGVKVHGGGGMQESALQRAAVGVLLKVDSITSKWQRSMINTL